MRLFIHVGPGKTGSSFIQRCLVDSADFLNTHGISPARSISSPDGDHHKLASLVMTSHQNKDSTTLARSLDQLAEDAQRIIAPNTVLSSDLFSNLSLGQWELLAEMSERSGFELHAILYGRNLFQIAISTISQIIKNGYHIDSIYRYLPFTYYPLLSRLNNILPSARIEILPYHGSSDLFKVFIDSINPLLGFVSPANCIVTKVNTSLRAEEARILNFVNQYLGCEDREATAVRLILHWLGQNTTQDGSPLNLSELEAHHLNEIFKQDRVLLEEHLPGSAEILVSSGCYNFDRHLYDSIGIDSLLRVDNNSESIARRLLSALNNCKDNADFLSLARRL